MSAGIIASHYVAGPGLTYDQEVAADTPFRYWKLEEPSGASATDSSGNAGNGTYVGTPTLAQAGLVASDPSATSALFPGAGTTRVTVVDSAGYDTADITVECWFKSTDATADPNIVSRDGGGAGNRSIQFKLSAGLPSFTWFVNGSTGSAQNIAGVSTVNDGVAHHMAATVNSTTHEVFLYVDGAQVATATGWTGTLSPSTFLLIGTRTSVANPYAGYLQKVAWYSSALSAARILAHYDAGT